MKKPKPSADSILSLRATNRLMTAIIRKQTWQIEKLKERNRLMSLAPDIWRLCTELALGKRSIKATLKKMRNKL